MYCTHEHDDVSHLTTNVHDTCIIQCIEQSTSFANWRGDQPSPHEFTHSGDDKWYVTAYALTNFTILILTPLTQPIINMFWHISLIDQVTQLPLTQFAQVLDPQKLYTQLTRKFHHSSRLAVEYGRTSSSEQSYLATTSLMSVSQYSASICTHIWPTFDSHNHLLSFTPHRWKLSSQNWSITPNVHQVINTITCTLSQMKVTVQ